jgi:hypothetical protein
MAKQIPMARACDLLRKSGRYLMVTYCPDGEAYSLPDGPISRRAGNTLTAQGELPGIEPAKGKPVLIPNDDGLFPGFTQTWRAVA